MRRILLIIFLYISSLISAQNDVWDKWDPDLIKEANTAKDFDNYSDEEKKVVFFMNLARLDGELFAETILPAYVEANNTDNNSYLKSLYRDLKKLPALHVLYPEEDLTGIAKGHATDSGKKGQVGHKNFSKRFNPFMGNPYAMVGENCSYGYSEALDIVISLLIDDGIKGVGHRKNTLSSDFNSVGVAIREHKSYRNNCVIDFGKKNRSNLNDIPF